MEVPTGRGGYRLAGRRNALVLLLLVALGVVRGAALDEPLALYRAGSFEQAYELAVAIDAGQAQTVAARAAIALALYQATSASQRLSWLERARTAAERAVALSPQTPAALLALAQAKGEIALRTSVLGNLSVAGDIGGLLKRAVALDPQDPDALVALGRWNLQVTERGVGWLYGAHRKGAVAMVQRGVALAPTRVDLRVEYATALRDAGDPSGARAQLEKALALPASTALERYQQQRAAALLKVIDQASH